MQKSTVLVKKMILSAFWVKLKGRWLRTGLADLKKHQTLAVFFCITAMVDFLHIFKITYF